jgi:hypothetical protein
LCISKFVIEGFVLCPFVTCATTHVIRPMSLVSPTTLTGWTQLLSVDQDIVTAMNQVAKNHAAKTAAFEAAPALAAGSSSAHTPVTALVPPTPEQPCEFAGCRAPASHVCFTCVGLTQFCATHDAALHVHFPKHQREAIQDKQTAAARHFLQMIAPAAAARRKELRDNAAASRQASAQDEAKVLELQAVLDMAQAALYASQDTTKASKAASDQLDTQSARAELDSDLNVIAEAVPNASPNEGPNEMPAGLLRTLTQEQKKHFRRLLPDLPPSKLRLLYRSSEHGKTAKEFGRAAITRPTRS